MYIVIKKIELENFKGFRRAKIEIKPITILVGPNNGGKTSILQSINLLKQTFSGNDTEILKFQGDLDFGDFDTVLHQNSEKKEIRLRFGFENDKYFDVKIKKNEDGKLFVKDFSCNCGEFENVLENIREDQEQFMPQKIIFKSNVYDNITERFKPFFYRENFLFVLSPSSEDYSEMNQFFDLFMKKYGNNTKSKIELGDEYRQSTKKYLDSIKFYFSIEKYIRDFYQNVKQDFENIAYIGPIRATADRSYSVGSYNNVGFKGDHAVQMIEKDSKLQKKANDALKNLEIAKATEILKSNNHKNFEFKFKTDIAVNGVNFADVGCGSAQILPIVIQSLNSDNNSMIIIEQPEVHLHPKVQADLASFIVKSIGSKTFLIETHSEYFIERIRTHIMEKPSLADDVAIYYIEQNENEKQSEITEIKISSSGQYSTLPDGYLINFRLKEMDTQMNLMLNSKKKIWNKI